MAEKIFCGTAKIVKTSFGELTKISFSQKDIDTLQSNMTNGWINLVVKEKKNKEEGKPTHYLEVDNWKKDENTVKNVQNEVVGHDASVGSNPNDIDDGNLPF